MELIKYFSVTLLLIIIFSIIIYIKYNANPNGLSKNNLFFTLLIMMVGIGSVIYQYFNPPLPNVSYAFIQSKKETIKRLMSEVTKGIGKPNDTREYTKQVGLSSLSYVYEGTSYRAIRIIESNVESLPKWVEVSTATQDDNSIRKSFCNGEFSLNLYLNTITISWYRDDYCWKKENGEIDD